MVQLVKEEKIELAQRQIGDMVNGLDEFFQVPESDFPILHRTKSKAVANAGFHIGHMALDLLNEVVLLNVQAQEFILDAGSGDRLASEDCLVVDLAYAMFICVNALVLVSDFLGVTFDPASCRIPLQRIYGDLNG